MDASAITRLSAVLAAQESRSGSTTIADESKSEPETDEMLLTQLSQGSQEALAVLFRRYARLVHAISNRILRNAAEAEDLLQELFLFLYRKAHVFDGSRCSARSWIVQMTYQRAIDRKRYLQARHFYAHTDVDTAAPQSQIKDCGSASELVEQMVRNSTIQELLGTLSHDQRRTLTLHFYDGCTFQEIAATLGQSIANVRNHYYRGLEKLRKHMFATESRPTNRSGIK